MNLDFSVTDLLITVFGAFGFYWQNNFLQKKIKEREQENFVHQLQFEKEFKIYSELWECLIEARGDLYVLRPVLDNLPLDELERKMTENIRLEKARLSCNKLITTTENNKPFYSVDIYPQLLELNKLAKKEVSIVLHKDVYLKKQNYDYYMDGEETLKRFNELADVICDKIRDRIFTYKH